jgi:hypothetical protein
MKLNKKTVSTIISLAFTGITAVNAQDNSICGIYLNSRDYNQGKISFAFNCNSSGKIKLNDFLSSKFVDVIIDGKRIQLNKDSIFGYCNCKNETYRFYKKHDEEFRILESKVIILYLSYIRVSSNNGKTNQVVPAYFFSKTDSSEILPLTIMNLKRVFPDNIKFHDMLDIEFGSGEPLSAYLASDKMYKVNELLNEPNLK